MAGVCALLAFVGWKITGSCPVVQLPAKPAAHGVSAVKPVPGKFERVLAVLALGGTALEVENAIGFLDTITRGGKGLTDRQRAAVLAALEQGTPETMAEGAWSHIFNSACNALATGRSVTDENLLALLEKVATDDPRLVMRLYALQHIGCRYDAASPASQQRLRDLVQRLLADSSSKTTGTALVLWRRWENSAEPGRTSTFDLSQAIAADAARPVDVRVTALHAIGGDPRVLDLARAIAPDRSQPLLLRKAALSLIGRHGEAQDLPVLGLCNRESPRLAQAGDPAVGSVKKRLAGISQPELHPY